MDLMNLLKDQLNNPNVLAQLGNAVGADSAQVSQMTQLGLPALLEGLARNTKTPNGAAALASALDQHQDDSVQDLSGFLQQVDRQDGEKILGHVFGNKTTRVENNLAQQTGLNAGQITGLLSMLAPLVIGALGNHKKEENLDANGIASLLPSLGSMLGGGASSGGGLSGIASLLDTDKDGNFMDDLQGFLGKLMK